jgi:hypothetical protein
MKYVNRFFVALFFISSANSLFGMDVEDNSFDEMYRIKAQEYLEKLKIKNPSAPLHQDALDSYLQARISQAERILSGQAGSEAKAQELRMLNPELVLPLVLSSLGNPNACVVCFYPDMALDTLSHRMRKKMGCRLGDLADFEKPYEDSLKLVSDEEFTKRAAAVSPAERDAFIFKNSKAFARAILAARGK